MEIPTKKIKQIYDIHIIHIFKNNTCNIQKGGNLYVQFETLCSRLSQDVLMSAKYEEFHLTIYTILLLILNIFFQWYWQITRVRGTQWIIGWGRARDGFSLFNFNFVFFHPFGPAAVTLMLFFSLDRFLITTPPSVSPFCTPLYRLSTWKHKSVVAASG